MILDVVMVGEVQLQLRVQIDILVVFNLGVFFKILKAQNVDEKVVCVNDKDDFELNVILIFSFVLEIGIDKMVKHCQLSLHWIHGLEKNITEMLFPPQWKYKFYQNNSFKNNLKIK